ncbi:MAG: hypothetical protein WCD36_11540 [Rhodanobacteraceae bacterium]
MKLPTIPASAVLAISLVFAVTQAAATQYPIGSGTVTINGSSEALPAGGTFGDSSYDAGTGYLSPGKFAFPQATVANGDFTITYQLAQSDTSAALVGSNGNVGFTTASMQLSIVSASYLGFPVSVSPCRFSPIAWGTLGGSASATGMHISNGIFTVPPTTDSCGGYQAQINDALAGNQNSITMVIDGNFTPPALDDRVYMDGFDTQPSP